MQIAALVYISLSEISKVMPDINLDWIDSHQDNFKDILWSLGGDINQPYSTQSCVQHTNRFNQKVTCPRYVLMERTDKEWVNSGYASQAAIDKSLGNKMLVDVYRDKGQVQSNNADLSIDDLVEDEQEYN